MEIWYHFHGQNETLFKSRVISKLEDAGLSTRQLTPEKASGPGVLFFKEITPQLCDFLCNISCRGTDRVLGIAVCNTSSSYEGFWHLLKSGASDVFAWDHYQNPAIEVSLRFKRWDAIDRLVYSELVQKNLIGQSPAWRSIIRDIVEVAHFSNANILINGESGTGKELAARLIHTLDSRPNKKDMVILDCTTIIPELSGSEFFGHEKGAFTGASAPRDGAFALANNGTLFLDEAGELPLGLQAQLLRVIQEGMYKPLGGNSWKHTDFRLVCATNKDLAKAVKNGEFRHDLYYRITSWVCNLPSLRERIEDIPLLVKHFIRQHSNNKEIPDLDEPVRKYLINREYPGNVRDLKQLVSRIMYRHIGSGPITVGYIPKEERKCIKLNPAEWRDEHFDQAIRHALSIGVRLKEIGRVAEEVAVNIAISNEDGNLQRAAKKLGVTDRSLQMRRAAQRERTQEVLQENLK